MFNIDFSTTTTISDLTTKMKAVDFNAGIDATTKAADGQLTTLANYMPDICNIGGTISGMLSNATSISETSKSSINGAATQFQSSMGDLIKNIASLIESVKVIFEKSKIMIAKFIIDTKDFAETLFLVMKNHLIELVATLNTAMTSLIVTLTQAISNTSSAITTASSGILSSTQSLITSTNPIAQSSVLDAVKTPGLDNLKNVCTPDNTGDKISSAFGGIGGSIGNLSSSVPSVTDIAGAHDMKLDAIDKWIIDAKHS